MRNVLKVLLRIIAIILFPITAGLYFIWPSRIFKDRMSKGWNIFWWITYALTALYCVAFKVLSCTVFILLAIGSAEGPSVSRDNVPAPDYKTSEDFYKLTGVEFPELEMVDSLFFQDGGFPTNHWKEYKFIAKDGLNDSFHKRLEQACETDSTHWSYTDGDIVDYFYPSLGEPIIGNQMHYHYRIYPDQEPVDRSRGMCDRMVEGFDGEMVTDWDGTYITVDNVNVTIILRNGWVH